MSSKRKLNDNETNYGVTKFMARKYGYGGNMENLPRSLAFEIYKKHYKDIGENDEKF